ncbi:NAD(P)/FAD-dependent oxidoreductase [Chromobacterium sphagni]|uniref:FAD-dependent oxidoreductase n=1 Tax=Chromobacterium sphagni TaxID=1903179 RepID=A0ABX3C7D9_9NEIS|nr:FAD-dependent monooxygenase [Chromobacterium sphagni]OHX16277.1 FAD-dependent oxidoreductase [Chromobacterium sphagni]
MTTPRFSGGHAVVIGGSVAGCLAAAVLAKRFEQVTVVEKGDFHDETGPRQSVPQEHHVHLLLQRGKEIMEDIFPGFLRELELAGAQIADLGHDVKWYQAGLWKNRYRSGIHAHYCSRRLIDNQLRRRIALLPRVTVLARTHVEKLCISRRDGVPTVSGVMLRQDDGERRLAADLVVDASGRGTRTPGWLEAAGLGSVEKSVVKTDLGYASRIYRRRPEFASRWQVLLVLATPPRQRAMGVISPIEGDRWMVTTGGWFGHYPDRDPEAFLHALAKLPVPDIHQVIREAEPLSEVAVLRMPGSQRRHYDRLPVWPDGLLVAGDALGSMNPLYSQGMTLCALEVECIDRHLERTLDGSLPFRDLQEKLCRVLDPAWQMAVTEDLRFPETEGKRNWHTRFHHWYGAGLARLSARHRGALELQIGVSNLITDPARLYAPAIVSRILLDSALPGGNP